MEVHPPGHEVHPQPEQESILGQFLLGGLDLDGTVLSCGNYISNVLQ